tara:strand:+ start:60 stop:338 length:279 start_codon:yes stop_codon:yes gene_type:complete
MMITRLVVTLGPHTLHLAAAALAAAALAAAALAAAALAAAALAFDRENPSTGRILPPGERPKKYNPPDGVGAQKIVAKRQHKKVLSHSYVFY